MIHKNTLEKILRRIIQAGALLGFVSVMIIFKELLFPYISSKQIYFNILMEITAIFWVFYIIYFPEKRPKKSMISIGLVAYFAVMLISCFTGVDFNLSFWGDVERMLGFFHLFHFLLFYLFIITVFKTWTEWKALLVSFLAVASVFSIHSFFSEEVYGQIGNTAYVSGYLIFGIYFSILLFAKEKTSYRYFYLLPLAVILPAFFRANTSGAFVGLGFSLICVLALYAFNVSNRKYKKIFLACLGVIMVVIISGFLLRNTDFAKGSSLLRPFRGISLEKDTFQTRLISWRAGLSDFTAHPFFGTGLGNYAITFDKYFDPKFYSYTNKETYFDRAHNNLIDIVSTTGSFGIITYLFVFGAVFYYLIDRFYSNKISRHDFILIFGLIIAYFVQNLAVFDSLATYISLMVALGYVHWLSQDFAPKEPKDPEDKKHFNISKPATIFLVGLVAGVSLFAAYEYNIKSFKMMKNTILAQAYISEGYLEKGFERQLQAESYESPLERDGRTTFVNAINKIGQTAAFKNSGKLSEEILLHALELCKENLAYNPEDTVNRLIYAQTLNTAAFYYADKDQQKSMNYSERSLEAIQAAIKSSPGRIANYYTLAQFYITRREKDKAVQVLQAAIELNPDYKDSYCYLARTYHYFDQTDDFFQTMNQCVEMGGAKTFDAAYLKDVINSYIEAGDTDYLIRLYEALVRKQPKNTEALIKLAKLYEQKGEKEKAKKTAEKLLEADPSLSQSINEFISGLE